MIAAQRKESDDGERRTETQQGSAQTQGEEGQDDRREPVNEGDVEKLTLPPPFRGGEKLLPSRLVPAAGRRAAAGGAGRLGGGADGFDGDIGIAVIGLMNFGVSFALALLVALRAREVSNQQRLGLAVAVLRRFLRHPFRFVFPPRDAIAAASVSQTGAPNAH